MNFGTSLFATQPKEITQRPTVSGYVTTYNCRIQSYPYKECIQSVCHFCNEVCVLDAGSTDGTWDELTQWAQREPKLKVKQSKDDNTHGCATVRDGMMKAEARRMCTSDFCWQMDADEVVNEVDYQKIHTLMSAMPNDVDIVSLPFIEYWGSKGKVRCDVIPQKWRLSRNKSDITHGIPLGLRRYDDKGVVIGATGNTDGCNVISISTGLDLPYATFYKDSVEHVRQATMQGNEEARIEYERWFNAIIEQLPSVHHYSWYDIARKMRLYRDFWQAHWLTLWDKNSDDTAKNNYFFDCPWSDVTDGMIVARAQELEEKTGGHVFHTKWVGQHTPSISVKRTHPLIMNIK